MYVKKGNDQIHNSHYGFVKSSRCKAHDFFGREAIRFCMPSGQKNRATPQVDFFRSR